MAVSGMFLMVGEKVKSRSAAIGQKDCPVCDGAQPFTEQTESLWFCLFVFPVLPINETARYWRCETCLSAYSARDLTAPSSVAGVKEIITYLLLGYDQYEQAALAEEVCLKLTGFGFAQDEFRALVRDIDAGRRDVVEALAGRANAMNTIGKQQVIEAAFVITHACCDIQFEDRLRINQIGSALGVGLEFVEFSISQARQQNDYGVRRLPNISTEV